MPWDPRAAVRCLNGDARVEETYRSALAGERARLLLTDPPYCLLTRRRKGGEVRDKRAGVKIDREPVVRFADVRAYRRFTEEWLPKAAARDEGPIIGRTNLLGKEPIRAVARELGHGEAGEFLWAKRTSQHEGNEQLLRVYETALVFLRSPLPQLQAADVQRVWCVAAGYDHDREGRRLGRHSEYQAVFVLEPLLRPWSPPGGLGADP